MANNDYITTDCKLTVSKNTAKLDEEIFLYKNDRNIKLLIEIVDNKYRYKSDDLSNLLVKYKASYAQVKWYKNAEVKKEFPIQATDDGKVVFVIEGELINEDTELGDYDLQLRLLNESQESIRSLPIIKGAVHILKPLFEEGDIATVNSAVADVSMLSLDGDAIDTYNSDGTYNQTNWGNGDVISSAKLNKLEKVAKDNVDKVNKMPAKSIVEGGKIYLAKEDGTKLDSGTELPAGGSTIEVVNNLESDSTTAALSAAQGKALNTQYKDIANYSLVKHTDGKVYIKKQDGTLLGDGIEIGGSDVDLSKITMSMSGQTLKLMNDGNQIATVEIPTAVVTDEQLTSIIQSKIDDGTLSPLKLSTGDVKVENCNFLEGITNFDNLHKKYTTGIGQSLGSIIMGGNNAISSVIKVKPNKSYNITITGEHDRFRLSKYNIEGTEIVENIKGVDIKTPSETTNEFVIDDIGDYNTLVITVSNSGQTPTLEVYKVGDSDVDFKFPVKADIVKDTATISGVSILDNTANGKCLVDNTVTPLKTTFVTEGKNKWKGEYLTGYAIIASGKGAITPQNTNCIVAYANIKSNTTYTVSFPNGHSKFRLVELNTKYDFTVDTPPSSGDKLIVSNDTLTEYTFTSSTDAKMLLVYMTDNGTMFDLQIEENDTKTDYRPYGFKLFDRYLEDITDISMVTQLFKRFIIDKDNSANKFYDCSELEYDKKLSSKQHTDIYAMYDELMKANSTYITSEVLGTTTYGNLEVRCYHFIPETLKITNFNADTGEFNTTGTSRIIHGRKRILCLSATHGDERSTVLGLYTFLKDVCENPTNNTLLNRVRREIEFIVVPVVNPTGFNLCSRFVKNSNGNVLDLNRQFTDNLLTAETYDNILNETKIIAQLIKNNKDTLTAVIDFHNMQPQKGKNISWFIMDGDDIVKRANQTINKVSPKWQQKYSFLEQDKGFLFAETTNSDIVYPNNIISTIQRFSHQLGLNALTLEFGTRLNYTGHNTAYSKEQLNLHLSLIGNLLCEYID